MHCLRHFMSGTVRPWTRVSNEVLGPIPLDSERQLSLGESKVILRLSNAWRVGAPNSCVVRGSTVLPSCHILHFDAENNWFPFLF